MNRVENWPSIMYAAIDYKRTQPFVWGKWDCCLFVCDIVYAFTGVDMAENFRGRYDSRKEANALMKRGRRKVSMEEFIDDMARRYGAEPIPIPMAGRGDVALFETELGETLGIFDGVNVLTMGYNGMIALPRTVALKAWRI